MNEGNFSYRLLETLRVIQSKSECRQNPNPELGIQHRNYRRFNPYNPLSYIVLAVILLTGIILFGVIGVWEQVEVDGVFIWESYTSRKCKCGLTRET